MPSMTQARTTSYGVVTPPPLHRWMHAVLMLFVSLVQGVAATFGMRRCSGQRDWHTPSEASALPQTKPGIHLKEQLPQLEAGLSARVPGAGRDPVSAHRALLTHTVLSIAPAPTLAVCHPGTPDLIRGQRYPGPIAQRVPASRWVPALRFAAAGMTAVHVMPA
jgi:hypothetical protein